MIIGDPYKFAIDMQKIEEWNYSGDNTFLNGVLLFFIDGAIFPTEIRTATLISELEPLKNVLENPIIDKRLFNMEKGDAYMELYDLTFPENDADNNYGYHLTPASLSEEHCHVFCVSDGLKTRVLGAHLDYLFDRSRHNLENIQVKEGVVSKEDVIRIIKYIDQLLEKR